jgi:hypothetical protein
MWFRDQVRKFGPWDYKDSPLRTQEDITNSTYDAYGNFQYGATGAAALRLSATSLATNSLEAGAEQAALNLSREATTRTAGSIIMLMSATILPASSIHAASVRSRHSAFALQVRYLIFSVRPHKDLTGFK